MLHICMFLLPLSVTGVPLVLLPLDPSAAHYVHALGTHRALIPTPFVKYCLGFVLFIERRERGRHKLASQFHS